ncbi:Seed maturation protein [Abeliophyllum distichum]|uniref:Seed maturation protein n=1 Tax=Abeliophyllum distichum TaxID=126358 RepID=A0ABD1TDS0_9LAMI
MSQEQPRRPEAVKYGDLFQVSDELASKPIAPQDAATMQAAENIVLGETKKGGTAAVMQSAADVNERRGAVGHYDMTDIVREQGATISETDVGGYRIITESVGRQVVGQYGQPRDVKMRHPAAALDPEAITIGEALEAAALSAGDKPIDESDAAAIQAAETRATGLGHVVPGGVGAEAQSAAAYNIRTTRDEQKTKLGDVLADASEKFADDKPVTRDDAEGVINAEIRNKPDQATYPGGVSDTMAAAARLNQE